MAKRPVIDFDHHGPECAADSIGIGVCRGKLIATDSDSLYDSATG